MKYVLRAKRVLRARLHKTWQPNTTQHDTRELAKKRFTLHEVRVAGKTCTSCKTTQHMATQPNTTQPNTRELAKKTFYVT